MTEGHWMTTSNTQTPYDHHAHSHQEWGCKAENQKFGRKFTYSYTQQSEGLLKLTLDLHALYWNDYFYESEPKLQ